MSNHDVHNKYDRQVFGCDFGQYNWVHELIDGPYPKMFGRRHRQILHDQEGIEAIQQLVTTLYGPVYGNIAYIVGIHHVSMDYPRTYIIENNRLVKLKRVHKKHKKHVWKKK